MPTLTSSREIVDQVLSEACARNLPVELHYEAPDSGRLIVGRTRLLRLVADGILTDALTYRKKDGPIPARDSVTAYLLMNDTRYAFQSAVEVSGIHVRLNNEKEVVGLALRRPAAIRTLQRRAHYRMALAGSVPVTVRLARCHPNVPDACPIDGRIGASSIVNLSARGIGLLIDRRVLRGAECGDRFYMTFTLPGIDDEFCMFGVVRHVSWVQCGGWLKVGVAFLPWAGQDPEKAEVNITRFTTDLERRRLRRRKR